MEPQAKKKSKLPLILIGCGGLLLVLLVVGGILAAIAIPAFLKFTNKAKAAEAEITVSLIANQAATHYSQQCAFPPSASPTSAIPTGGDKQLAKTSGPGWDELGVPFLQEEMYFAYRTENQGDTLLVLAEADFKKGGAKHTVTVAVTGTNSGDGNCHAEVGNTKKENEQE